MPFNGSGIYTLPGAQLVNGEIVSATENNTSRNDFATALNTCWTRDGQSTATGNIPMGSHKFTGLSAGTANGDSVRYEQTTLKTGATASSALPSGTTAQRDGTPAAGYIRFNSDNTKFEGYNGTDWDSIGGGATGGGSDEVFILNGQTVTTDYTIPTSFNAGTFGPVSINSGVTVTVPDGSTWTVV